MPKTDPAKAKTRQKRAGSDGAPNIGAGSGAPETTQPAPAESNPAPKKKRGPPKGSGGRPSKYTPEIAEIMCEMLSQGIPLREICRQEGFPVWQKIYEWMGKDAKLAGAIARAREVGYDALAEECVQIADDGSNDWMERLGKEGQPIGWQLNGEHVQRSKLRIETRLKLLAKWNPKKYGDTLKVAGDAENPLAVSQTVEVKTMFDTILKNMELRRQAEAAEPDAD